MFVLVLLEEPYLIRRALVGRRGAQQYTVSNKFINFFYKLWTIFKLDTLIKVNLHTMMQLPQFAEAKTLQETAALLEMRMDEMKLLGKGNCLANCLFSREGNCLANSGKFLRTIV